MPEIRTILVPTDFSDASKHALEYAKILARACQARIEILYVDDDPTMISPTTGQDYRDEFEAHIREKFDGLLTAEEEKQFQTQFQIRCGSAFVEIVRYAKELPADMIVMATHGRSGIAHMLLGSVAENVLRTSPCPVLSVRDPKQSFHMP